MGGGKRREDAERGSLRARRDGGSQAKSEARWIAVVSGWAPNKEVGHGGGLPEKAEGLPFRLLLPFTGDVIGGPLCVARRLNQPFPVIAYL